MPTICLLDGRANHRAFLQSTDSLKKAQTCCNFGGQATFFQTTTSKHYTMKYVACVEDHTYTKNYSTLSSTAINFDTTRAFTL